MRTSADAILVTYHQEETICSGSTVTLHKGQGGKPAITLTSFNSELLKPSLNQEKVDTVFDSNRPCKSAIAIEKLGDKLEKHFNCWEGRSCIRVLRSVV